MRSNTLLRGVAAAWLSPLAAASPLPDEAAESSVAPRMIGAAAAAVAVTENYVPMRKLRPVMDEESLRRYKRAPYQQVAGEPPKLRNSHDLYYAVDITIGENQTVALHLDTGSSDTWLVQEDFTCVDFNYFKYPKEMCGFGQGVKSGFSQGVVPNRTFIRSYGDGTFVQGTFGYEDVTIGGIKATRQQIAHVNYTYWFGDRQTSGLLGLAYPLMTGFDGFDDPTHQYDPIFTSMWKQKGTTPLFSIALSRDVDSASGKKEEESFLAFGGVPPVEVDEATWSKTPIQLLQTLRAWNFVDSDERGLYVITPEAFIYGPGNGSDSNGPILVRNTTQVPVVIDVGSSLSILPRGIVDKIYALYNPPATYLSEQGIFYAPCNATAPKFGVQIGKQVYYISPEDLLRQEARDSTGKLCRVGITDNDVGPHILGIPFLANVVAVFDQENNEMRFAARKPY